MEELVEISQFCFHLEDMHDISPFWEWIDNRIRPERICTEPEELEAIMKGLKNADEKKYLEPDEVEVITIGSKKVDENETLIMGVLRRETDTFCIISGLYKAEWPTDILDFDVHRLSDHRFKVEITFWDPDGWPKIAVWDYFYRLMRDLSHDYPEIIVTLRNSYLGFEYSPLNDKQRTEMLWIEEDPDGNNSIYQNIGSKARRPPGRKHLADDIWAYREVNKKDREPSEVYKDWINRPGVKLRNLQDPDRQFKLIIRPSWL
jgi:hypothetical protein